MWTNLESKHKQRCLYTSTTLELPNRGEKTKRKSTFRPASNPKYKKKLIERQHVDQSRIEKKIRNEKINSFTTLESQIVEKLKETIVLATLESKAQEKTMECQHVDQSRLQE